MANPSLQIGNDNWAIKEDNLLGYSTAGTRFVPQPITMTRATLGTRVNPSGLVEDVELLGSELVTNGDFATDSNWTKGTGWTISGGSANSDGANSFSSLSQASVLTIGKFYKLEVDINLTSGQLRIQEGGTILETYTTTGTNTATYYFTATATNITFKTSVTPFLGSIDNVSVKEATIDNLPRVDYTDGTSSLLVEPERTNLITYSEDFSDSSWLRAGSITTTDNYTTSPSGQNNATRLQWTNATNFIYQNVSHVGSDFTLSIYLKSNTGVSQNVKLFMDNGAQTTNVVVTTQWQRFEFTSTSTPTQSNRNTGLIKSSSQVGNLDISIWSAQFEQGSYPTSYIPTSGSTVTRNQDIFTRDGIGSLINSTEGVLFLEVASFVKINPSGNITLTDGSGDNRIYIYYLVDNSISVIYNINSTGAAIHNFALADITQQTKIAVKWGDSNVSVWINGSSVLSAATSNFLPNTLNQLSFSKPSGSVPFEGKVKQLQVYNTALTDSELATLTT